MCGFNKGVCVSKKEKWATEIMLNLTDLFNKRKKKDAIRRKDDESEKAVDSGRDSDKSNKK